MNKVFIACDFNSREQLEGFLTKFSPQQSLALKLGMELIYAIGFDIISELKKHGHIIFLDLKLNDIPVTIERALIALKKYQVDFITIHLTSGRKTLELAHKIVQDTSIKLLGVTVLTILDNKDVQELFLSSTLTTDQLVKNLAELADNNHFYGVICAPTDVTLIKQHFPSLKTFTHGIKLTSKQINQKRIATPLAAKQLGADNLVVGRAITMADNPVAVYKEILSNFTEGGEI